MSPALRRLWKLCDGVCWRLARLESPPLAELVPPAELPALMSFLEESIGLVDEPEWADRPFRAPNPLGSRFSDGSYGVFYAGLDLETCVAEMAHYQVIHMRQNGAPGMRVHFTALRAHVSGDLVDVRKGYDHLHRPKSHAESKVFGVQAWKAGADGIAYRSVRHAGGECLAIFRRKCVLSCARGGLVALEWDGTTMAVAM